LEWFVLRINGNGIMSLRLYLQQFDWGMHGNDDGNDDISVF
jgi:hypothetical protein